MRRASSLWAGGQPPRGQPYYRLFFASDGVNLSELSRQTAIYAAKILKGAKPAELPVEQPTKFELVINLKTAKGLTITRELLLIADDVIEWVPWMRESAFGRREACCRW
jgi:ABC transporter substrate binding protein